MLFCNKLYIFFDNCDQLSFLSFSQNSRCTREHIPIFMCLSLLGNSLSAYVFLRTLPVVQHLSECVSDKRPRRPSDDYYFLAHNVQWRPYTYVHVIKLNIICFILIHKASIQKSIVFFTSLQYTQRNGKINIFNLL